MARRMTPYVSQAAWLADALRGAKKAGVKGMRVDVVLHKSQGDYEGEAKQVIGRIAGEICAVYRRPEYEYPVVKNPADPDGEYVRAYERVMGNDGRTSWWDFDHPWLPIRVTVFE